MAERFSQYLAARGKLANPERLRIEQSPHQFREVIGAIALRYELMTPAQIDEILLNSGPDHPFHQLARERGYLNDVQVERLQRSRDLEEAVQFGIQAMLDGQIRLPDLLRELQSFFETSEGLCSPRAS